MSAGKSPNDGLDPFNKRRKYGRAAVFAATLPHNDDARGKRAGIRKKQSNQGRAASEEGLQHEGRRANFQSCFGMIDRRPRLLHSPLPTAILRARRPAYPPHSLNNRHSVLTCTCPATLHTSRRTRPNSMRPAQTSDLPRRVKLRSMVRQEFNGQSNRTRRKRLETMNVSPGVRPPRKQREAS